LENTRPIQNTETIIDNKTNPFSRKIMGKRIPLVKLLVLTVTFIITIPPVFESIDSGFARGTYEEPFELVKYLGLGETINIEYSPDGAEFAVIASTKILIIHSTTFKINGVLLGHENGVTDISWSPDSEKLASSSLDTTARVWDLATGEADLVFNMHEESVDHIEWSPDGSSIATSSEEIRHEVLIWDPETGELIEELSNFDYGARSIAWSPEGSLLAVGEGNGNVEIYSTLTWKRQYVLDGHRTNVHYLEWSHDGTLLASGSSSLSVKIWNTFDWSVLRSVSTSYAVTDIAFSPDDSTFALCSWPSGVVVVDTSIVTLLETNNWTITDTIEPDFEYEPVMCDWHPEGDELATVGGGGYAVFDVETGEVIYFEITDLGNLYSPDWNSDGTKFIVGSYARISRSSYDYRRDFIVYDTTDWDVEKRFSELDITTFTASWSTDGSMLAFGSGKNMLSVYSVSDWELITRLDLKYKNVTDISWSPDDSKVAVASYDYIRTDKENDVRFDEVEVWDTDDWLRMRPHANMTNMRYPAWSSDGSMLALGTMYDERIEIFDSENLELLNSYENNYIDTIYALDWSPDDSTFAVLASRNVRLIDTNTWFNFKNLTYKETNYLSFVKWSPDGTRLAAGPFRGTGTDYGGWHAVDQDVYVWDCQTYELLQNLTGHSSQVSGFCWSPDSRSIATTASDGVTNIWEDSSHVTNKRPKIAIKTADSDIDDPGTIIVTGTAEDENELKHVEVKIGDEGSWQLAEGTTNWSYEWRTGTIIDLEATIYARSSDGYLYSKSDSYELEISNPDYDGDGVPDITDSDDDNDGYIDTTELQVETNPLDYMSRPKDNDNDLIPDSMDVDIDNDGVVNSEDSDPYDKSKWDDTAAELLLWVGLAVVTTVVAFVLFVIRLKLGGRKKP
jgi:WD40 repeat protein